MKRPFRWFAVLAGLAAATSCATKSLPSGTPPPEYEQRALEPWPPEAISDAGADAEPVPRGPSPADDPVDFTVPADASVAPADAPAEQ